MPVNVDELIKSFEASRRTQISPQMQMQQLDMAKYILNHANVNWQNLANMRDAAAKRDTSGPSVISRIFDVLSRPNYAVANLVKQGFAGKTEEVENPLEALWNGLAGYEKTTFSDVIKQVDKVRGIDSSNLTRYGGGFALDVAADPTTYMGTGAIKAIARLLGVGKGALETGGKAISALDTIPNKPYNIAINKFPQELDVVPTQASHFNLASKPSDLISAVTPPPSIFEGFAPKVADIDIPALSKSEDVISSLAKIDKTSKNMARRRFAAEFMADLKTKLPDAKPEDLTKKMNLWMMEYFPKSGSAKYKEITEQIAKDNPELIKAISPDIAKTSQTLSDMDIFNKFMEYSKGVHKRTGYKPWSLDFEAWKRSNNYTTTTSFADLLKGSTGTKPGQVPTDKAAFAKFIKDNEDRMLAAIEGKAPPAEAIKKLSDTKLQFPVAPPALAPKVMRGDEILDLIQKGDESTVVDQAFNIEHRNNILNELGNAGASETAQSIKYADSYINRVLSKPNKFPKSNAKEPVVLNPAQQANLAETFMRISRQTKGNLNAFRMIRTAEDYLISKGYNPSFWDGTHVRLSDVILEMAHSADEIPNITRTYLPKLVTDFKNSHKPGKNADIRIAQTIENLRAASAANEAPVVNKVIDESSKVASIADKALSDPKYKQFIESINKQAKNNLEIAGTSPSSIKATQHLINTMFTKNAANPPLIATQTKSYYIHSYMQGDKRVWQPVQAAQTKAISDVVGTPITSAAKAIGPGNKAVDFFMTRFATWYGQKDLRPEVLIQTMGATANAAARARVWNNVSKQFSTEELEEGFKFAQSKIPMGAATDNVEKAGQIFQKAMQNLFDSTGLTKEALRGSSVASRSGMLIDDINKQLELVKAPFRFRSGKYFDTQGNLVDYSKGVDWLKSWEMADVKDPLEFMFKVETAVEQLMHKYTYLDEIAARWGSTVRTSEFNTPIIFNTGDAASSIYDLPAGYARASKAKTPKPIKSRAQKPKQHRLDGLYFSADIAPQIKRSLETWDQIYNPSSDLIKLLDRVTRAWKSGVTIYAPSHHIRNLIGDVYLSWMAGVNNPSVYGKAAKIIWSQKDRYKDLESVENLVGRDALSKSLTKPGDVVVRTRAGKELTAEQIYIAAHNTGLLPHTSVIEELFGEPLIKAEPFKGKVRDFVRGTAENREHFVRLAHFIDVLEKSKETNLQILFKDASKIVRKWHPDGSDLTDFERNVLRRLMPFYSWTRKSIPLLIEGAVMNPGKTLVYPKFMQAMQGLMGIESPGRTDPFPNDQLFPDWIKEKGIGPILRHGLTESGLPGLLTDASRSIPGFTGEDSGYSVVNPSNPLIDMVAQYAGMGNPSDPIKGLGQLLTPALKIPSEVIHGETFTGAPIEPGRYIAENIPIASMFSRVTGIGAFGPTQRGQEEGFNYEALVNLLTALGLQGTGPYIKSAEFQERDRRRAANAQ